MASPLLSPSTTKTNQYPIFELQGEVMPKNIFEAAERGNLAYITRLLERTVEIDINQRDSLQRTPLHWAAELGHIECAKVLLENGADVPAMECNGRTAIHLASRSADAEMLHLLLEGLDTETKKRLVNQTDMFGITPIFLALKKAEEGRAALEVLISNGAVYLSEPKSKPTAHEDELGR